MPPIYAVISFFSYRFFRYYTYYSLIQSSEFWVPFVNDRCVVTDVNAV